MSWNQIKKICFGSIGIKPKELSEYLLSDLWLTVQGWDDQVMFNLSVQRKLTAITAETINRSLGGNGAIDYVMKSFELPTDNVEITMTADQHRERFRELRAKREALIARKKAEAEQKKLNG